MATEGINISISLLADADRSAAQFLAVKGSGTTAKTFTLAGNLEGGIGILQDDPNAAGRAGKVMTYGLSKALLGNTVTAWASLTSDANAALIPVAGGVHVATALEGGVAGEYISVFVNGAL